jgi:hypothetical protein
MSLFYPTPTVSSGIATGLQGNCWDMPSWIDRNLSIDLERILSIAPAGKAWSPERHRSLARQENSFLPLGE